MSIPHPTAREPDPDSLVVARIPWISLIILLLMAGVMYFLDEVVSMGFKVFDPPGDVDQELEALQQFGQFGSLVLVAIIVCRLQPPPIRRTLLDLGLASLVGSLIANGMKTVLGRVRPPFGSPDEFHPIFTGEASAMSWSHQASMPSSHTMAAAVLATWMAIVFPRVRWVGFVLVAIVALSRVRFQHHWPSDVFVGAALGVFIGSLFIGRLLATRLLDVLWRIFVDRNATAAAPEVAAAVRRRQEAARIS